MTGDRTLQKIYEKHLSNLGIVTPLEKAVCAFIKSNPPVFSVLDQLTIGHDDSINKISAKKIQSPLSKDPWDHIENWRELLAVNLMTSLQEIPQVYRQAVLTDFQELSKFSFWAEFQLQSAFLALNNHLLGLESIALQPYLLESGAVPLDYAGHWRWGEIPHIRFHAELGILWCLLGKVGNQSQLVEAAVKLAEWHLNTLDFNFVPFSGLFIQETDACLCSLLSYNYLLFHAIGVLAEKPEMEHVAQKQLEQLERIAQPEKMQIAPLTVLLEAWIERLKQGKDLEKLRSVKFELPTEIQDPYTALVGHRSSTLNLVCTAFGGKTGLGCMHCHDIQIVNYGPQHLPLGECEGFGIEGGSYSYQNHLPATMECMKNEFFIQRAAHLAAKPDYTPSTDTVFFRKGEYSGIWLTVSQHFQVDTLHIETSFLGVKQSDALAFTFFLKGHYCTLVNEGKNGTKQLHPQSLDRYQGRLQKVCLYGERTVITLDALWNEGEMQLIPLAGGDSFWGADFLLAYILPVGVSTLKWNIASHHCAH